jgi:hypothetical protein
MGEESAASALIAEGTRVKIQGLKAKPELNGRCGTVGPFHRESGRYKVTVDESESGEVLALKPAVLQVVSSPDASGSSSSATFATGTSPDGIEDISTDVPLTKGLRIKVANLRARPEMNGKFGFLEEWLEDAGRWKVKVDDGEFLSLKPQCIEPSPGTPYDPNEFVPIYKRKGPQHAPDDMQELLLNPPKPPGSCPEGASLWLLGRHLHDPHARGLAESFNAGKWRHLKYVNFASNNISYLGFNHVMHAIADGATPLLEQLAVSDNPFGDLGASGLGMAISKGSMPNLLTLDANRCGIGDRGACAIWSALGEGHTKKMESIYLKEQQIGDEGHEAMCKAFKGGADGALPKLWHLQLGGNQLTDEGCLVMANAIEAGDLAHVRNLYVMPSPVSVDGQEVVQQTIDEMGYKQLHVFF